MITIDDVLVCLARAAANGRPEDAGEVALLCKVDLSEAEIRKSSSGDILIVNAHRVDFNGSISLSTSGMAGYAVMMQLLGGEKLRFDNSLPPLALNWEFFPAERGDGYLARASEQHMTYQVMVENALGDATFFACGPDA